MKINYQNINPTYEINKQQIHRVTEPITKKKNDQNRYTTIEPIVPVQVSKNLILTNDLLSNCVETLSQDVILNELTITNKKDKEIDDEINKFWNIKNIYELYLALQDRIAYGYGALEIITNKNDEPYGLKQISAETLNIAIKKNMDNTESYYAQYNDGRTHKLMKLSHYDYSEEDDELKTVLWLGGKRYSDFYDIPCWLPSFNKISANTTLDELNSKKVDEGNLISGILTVITPPFRSKENKTGREQIETTLKEQMQNAGTGIMTLHLEQLTADLPLNVQYIPITDQNYDYLLKLAENCDNSILRDFKIPKVRLMIDDVKESMNSSKTDAIWEIYTKELISQQIPYENIINQFNLKYFEKETETDIGTPIFSDKKQIEVQSTIQLFQIGLFTLGQAINNIKQYYPELDLEIDEANPLFYERYYNGRVFGFNNYNDEIGKNELEEFYAFFEENPQ